MAKSAIACLLATAILASAPAVAQESDPLSVLDGAGAPVGAAVELQARGVLEPGREAMLSAPIDGRIVELAVEDGDRIAEGGTLVRFDCALTEARLAAAEADRQGAAHTLQNTRRLAALNSVGALELAVAGADYRRAEAEVRQVQILAGRCTLPAPFSGRVVEVLANAHETVSAGEELMSILDDGILDISLIVPSAWLVWLEPGTPFDFRVDETGGIVAAEVAAIGARVDPASQSVRISGRLTGEGDGLLAGMSGTAVFARPGG
jgi:RND family efflux transporter MFP subunit